MLSSSRLPHLVRGSSAAAVATFAALFSHVLAGGEPPAPLGICVPLLLSLLVSVLLAGRKLSLIRLSASVFASQALFHTLFVLGAPSSGVVQSSVTGGAHQHHGQLALQLPVVSDETIALFQGSGVMWLSHFIGAAVTILFLYRGEQAIHRIRSLAERFVAWARLRFPAPLRVSAAPLPVRVPLREAHGCTVLAQMHASTLSRRGPPALLRIAAAPHSSIR